MADTTGGPAFPVPYSNERDGPTVMPSPGMTLRDYFAAKAMQAHAAGLGEWAATSPQHWHNEVARLAYMTADAMLKAREAGNG